MLELVNFSDSNYYDGHSCFIQTRWSCKSCLCSTQWAPKASGYTTRWRSTDHWRIQSWGPGRLSRSGILAVPSANRAGNPVSIPVLFSFGCMAHLLQLFAAFCQQHNRRCILIFFTSAWSSRVVGATSWTTVAPKLLSQCSHPWLEFHQNAAL